MPRPKNAIKLTVEDIEAYLRGENGEIKKKVDDWLRGELARRKAAGNARKASKIAKKLLPQIEQKGVEIREQYEKPSDQHWTPDEFSQAG